MRIVKRAGKVLKNAGKLVTNNECCCDNCLEDCVDSTISADIPTLGTFVLSSYTPGSPVEGCCYWRNLAPDPDGDGDCTITAIHASLCIVDETVTLTITVDDETPATLKSWSKEYAKCDFCALMPGFAELDPAAGDCYDDVATLTFASSCCHPPDCNCDCYVGDCLFFDWLTEPPDYDEDDCTFNLCRDNFVDFPAPPYQLDFVTGNETSSYYSFEYSPEGGGTFSIGFTCDKSPDNGELCDCDVEHWDNCEYTLLIECSNGCSLLEKKCVKTLPTAGFPLTFSNAGDCADHSGPCGEICNPWEAEISTGSCA
jgi:hypothetical protein